jgi:hypothetical protein
MLAGLALLTGLRMDYTGQPLVAAVCWLLGGVLVLGAWALWRRSAKP